MRIVIVSFSQLIRFIRLDSEHSHIDANSVNLPGGLPGGRDSWCWPEKEAASRDENTFHHRGGLSGREYFPPPVWKLESQEVPCYDGLNYSNNDSSTVKAIPVPPIVTLVHVIQLPDLHAYGAIPASGNEYE